MKVINTLTLGGACAAFTMALAVPVSAAPIPAAQCSRADLHSATEAYVSAQQTGDVTRLMLAQGAAYSENFQPTAIAAGMLSQGWEVDHHQSLLDTVNCSTWTEIVITDPAHPFVLATQMQLSGGKISKIETIVTDGDDWLFNAARTYQFAIGEGWGRIPVYKRNRRAEIQAAADAYLDLFNNPAVEVPWGTPCARLEGGIYTGRGQADDTCDIGVPSGIELKHRRYVIDETKGAVAVFLEFGGTGGGLPDSHTFRIEDGLIRYIHTVTHCFEPNCGFDPVDWDNPPGPPETAQ